MTKTRTSWFLLPLIASLLLGACGAVEVHEHPVVEARSGSGHTAKPQTSLPTVETEALQLGDTEALQAACRAADRILVPLQTEYYALEGLSSLIDTVEQVRASRNPSLQIDGIVRTMHDHRNRLGSEVSAQLLSHFGEKVYRTVIPRNVRVAEAPSHGLPVIAYDRHSRGAAAYAVLAEEMLKRHREQTS